MAEFPTLDQLVLDHTPSGAEGSVTCWCGKRFASFGDHSTHVSAAWREACTIRTVKQLDALPADSVVITPTSRITYQKARSSIRVWYSSALATHTADYIGLPALLVWHPDWERGDGQAV